MSRRRRSETGFYHISTRGVGQIALFEGEDDRRKYLHLLREARDAADVRILAWVLMTDHVHLVVDTGERAKAVSEFMYLLDKAYSRYFNDKTGRVGHLLQGNYWSKAIETDEQLVATVHYVHMNPEVAGIAPMREYRWSSYQEYAGKHWVVETNLVIDYFGSFAAFDAYQGSYGDVVRQFRRNRYQDDEVLALACELSECNSSSELRALSIERRDALIKKLGDRDVSQRMIARALGIGVGSVSRILKS